MCTLQADLPQLKSIALMNANNIKLFWHFTFSFNYFSWCPAVNAVD